MSAYAIALFVHFLGLAALFGAFAIYLRAGIRLRASQTMEEVHAALGLIQTTRGMFPGGWTLLLASGIYMTATRWRSPQPFISVGIITVLILWLVGTLVLGRHQRAVRTESNTEHGPVSPALLELIRTRVPWAIVTAANTATLGVVFVMTTKPDWLASIAIVLLLAALGAVIGTRMARGGGRRP